MAAIPATAGPLGQRKVFSFTPRLTGKAVVPISHYLTNQNCVEIDYERVEECRAEYLKTAESALLTGIALCRLWEHGQSGKIPSYFYDMNFMSAGVAPMECIDAFVRSQGFNEPLQEILERALLNGTITLSSPPVPELYRVEELSESDFKRLYPNIDLSRLIIEEPEKWTVVDKNYEISNAIFTYMKNDPFDWDLIVWSLARELGGTIASDLKFRDLDPSIETKQSTYLYNNLDQAVIDLFRQGGFATYQAYHRIVSA